MLHRIALMALAVSVTLAAQTKQASPAQKAAAAKKTAPAANPTAILHTTVGDMKCELFPSQAPKAVANFIGLAKGTKPWKDPAGKMVQGKPLYDGVIFHRVIPNFMIQGGDPTGSGAGDVGFEFADELHADLLFDQPGRLAMANRGPNTNSSQFFISEVPLPSLNPCLDEGGCNRPYGHVAKNSGYTIFGQCDQATVELVKKVARMPCQGGQPCTGQNSRPQDPVKITHVEIVSGGAASKPSARKTTGAKTAPVKPTPTPSPGK
jgi:peptidyl-prolyl cis-trans isomerase A (cyclophilin A)